MNNMTRCPCLCNLSICQRIASDSDWCLNILQLLLYISMASLIMMVFAKATKSCLFSGGTFHYEMTLKSDENNIDVSITGLIQWMCIRLDTLNIHTYIIIPPAVSVTHCDHIHTDNNHVFHTSSCDDQTHLYFIPGAISLIQLY